jgi:hypothetical protein
LRGIPAFRFEDYAFFCVIKFQTVFVTNSHETHAYIIHVYGKPGIFAFADSVFPLSGSIVPYCGGKGLGKGRLEFGSLSR